MTTARGGDLTQILAELPRRSPLLIVVLDTGMRIMWVNDSLSRFCATPAEAWVGRGLAEMLPGLDVGGVESMLRHVLETGERVADMEFRGPHRHRSRTNPMWSISGSMLADADGEVVGVALIASDTTVRSRERRRYALLNEASEKIGSTLDIKRTARETIDVLVPRVGDTAIINLLSYVLDGGPQPRFKEHTGQLRMEIAAGQWLAGQATPEELLIGSTSYLDPSSLYYRWLAEGRTLFEPRLSEPSAAFDEMTRSRFFQRRLRLVRQAGCHSGMIVPISARGVVLGTLPIFRLRGPAFTEQDVSLVQDVLARSAICLDNARVYSRERTIALELQRSMLPQSIAQAPGIEVAYRYEPANVAAEIGGDWFDVVHQPDGRVALVVGDVTGHDIHAASLMGRLRTVARTLATLGLSPVEVLTQLDAIVSEMDLEAGATLVYATFEPGSRRCVIARAGHPPPALVHPAGGVEFLDMPAGLPLGVGGAEFESVELDLQPGCVLVLYTDGLIETRDAPIDAGMDKLARALADRNGAPFGASYASQLIERLVSDPGDDIALLLARVTE